ncbi:hypothetical protein [Microbacterium sp. 77mftsu3.1]|uniref:hypothetical protein n=1 Tax=Microbacterium sp. 77mftsu3.1 TaxID=1761802 RepID=UPI0003798ED0|nr:hypothetical protein [Microbacterium sp. 77mftsu3.1]SDG22025.1 hypothetical protein SAMN04488590_0224 [Microbacterium sp. 77mftsu3.1]
MSLTPILNSPIDRPAKSVSDVEKDVREQVELALADTTDRIDLLTREIDQKAQARGELQRHRLALMEWLDNHPAVTEG